MTDTAIRNRFSSEVFASAFFDDYPLEAEEFRLYVHIQRRAGNSGCFESIPKMAQHCQIAEKTAKHAVKLLLKAGMIRIQQRSGTTNVYTLTPASQWVNPDQVQLLRSQIKKGRVKNDPSQKSTGCNFDPSQKGMGGGGKFDPTSGGIFAPGVGSKMTDEGIPIKEIPIKVLPLRDAPLQNNPLLNDVCVCETEQTNLLEQVNQSQEEPTPQQLTSLLKKSEYKQQTDNPSCGLSIAAGSFDKVEQVNKAESNQASEPKRVKFQSIEDLIDQILLDPSIMASDSLPAVYKSEIKMRGWRFPWRTTTRDKIYQTCDRRLVELIAAERASWDKVSCEQKIPAVISSIVNWESTKGGWEKLMSYWQRILQQQPAPTATASNDSRNISLAEAIAQDKLRRQQEELKPQPELMPLDHIKQQLLAKLEVDAVPKTVQSTSRFSHHSLRELEAQLKLARA
ncbi:hypothetical protein FNW02_35100 [Komarekiella sp. 'clone 1']|uniref:Helix-turn-helix domain-containing protein n=1 Tax=Komarekiella delphini-convector SJRDD-AB1 TaxID=2593771 RepID=A0AA40T4L4_9NOST|nr:hypothetical protein [Komarekiella delphini-convector]MBD6620841.1 hypothetical protein [Komarekiella delphini-convector SJRDD-AB1]